MLGFIDGHKSGMTRQDRLIILDQQLIKLNQPPTTKEERERADYFKERYETLRDSQSNKKFTGKLDKP